MADTQDALQIFRMAFVWPLICGTIGAWATMLVVDRLRLLSPRGVAMSGAIGGGTAFVIAEVLHIHWRQHGVYNPASDWLWYLFTVGLAIGAVVLAVATLGEFCRLWRVED